MLEFNFTQLFNIVVEHLLCAMSCARQTLPSWSLPFSEVNMSGGGGMAGGGEACEGGGTGTFTSTVSPGRHRFSDHRLTFRFLPICLAESEIPFSTGAGQLYLGNLGWWR